MIKLDLTEIINFLRSAKSAFVYTILTKWMTLITISAMTVAFIVLKKLDEIGLLDKIFALMKGNFEIIEKMASECAVKILDVSEFLSCIGNV